MNNNKIKVGLVMKALRADFFREMQQGAERWAAEQENIELISVGTDTQTEIERQCHLVDELVNKGVDGLLVVPIDSKALIPPVTRAVHAGVIVANIDIKLDEEILKKEGITIPFIGPDNQGAAIKVGRVLACQLQKGDDVAIIEGLRMADNCQKRTAGFRHIIDEFRLHLVASETADWETNKAERIFVSILENNKNLKGVFCDNDAMALGVIKLLKVHGLDKKIKVVGFDNDASSAPFLHDGSLLATIDAFGSEMAVEGIKCILRIMAGEKPEPLYDSPYLLIS
jgi:ribose transport system substrate-binding protein